MEKEIFESIDWGEVDSCDDSWRDYASFAFSKESQEYKSFKDLYDKTYPSGGRGIYYPKYVQLIAKAKCLKFI